MLLIDCALFSNYLRCKCKAGFTNMQAKLTNCILFTTFLTFVCYSRGVNCIKLKAHSHILCCAFCLLLHQQVFENCLPIGELLRAEFYPFAFKFACSVLSSVVYKVVALEQVLAVGYYKTFVEYVV